MMRNLNENFEIISSVQEGQLLMNPGKCIRVSKKLLSIIKAIRAVSYQIIQRKCQNSAF